MDEPPLDVQKPEDIESEDNGLKHEAVEEKLPNMSPGAIQLRKWLNKTLKIEMSDGRVLVGVFLCTDRDANVILGSCSEYLQEESTPDATANNSEEPRMLGLVMVPGKHIVNISLDDIDGNCMERPLISNLDTEGIM